jgi:hypothetical protein
MTDWKPETFETALNTGPHLVAGYTYRGLGLYGESSRDGKSGSWTLTHLGTGHMLAHISGGVQKAFPVATEIAEAGDWDFLSLQGWKDRFPDAPERLDEICAKHSNVRRNEEPDRRNDHETAQKIAANRP